MLFYMLLYVCVCVCVIFLYICYFTCYFILYVIIYDISRFSYIYIYNLPESISIIDSAEINRKHKILIGTDSEFGLLLELKTRSLQRTKCLSSICCKFHENKIGGIAFRPVFIILNSFVIVFYRRKFRLYL